MEKRLLKVLKALAEYHDLSLGDLLEGIVLHAFDGKTPFSTENLKRIHDLKKFYALDLDSSASHRLTEIKRGSANKTVSEKKIVEKKNAGKNDIENYKRSFACAVEHLWGVLGRGMGFAPHPALQT